MIMMMITIVSFFFQPKVFCRLLFSAEMHVVVVLVDLRERYDSVVKYYDVIKRQ